MYIVTVFRDSEVIDERQFSFGTWNEIGLYLDIYGYNDSRYELRITFVG